MSDYIIDLVDIVWHSLPDDTRMSEDDVKGIAKTIYASMGNGLDMPRIENIIGTEVYKYTERKKAEADEVLAKAEQLRLTHIKSVQVCTKEVEALILPGCPPEKIKVPAFEKGHTGYDSRLSARKKERRIERPGILFAYGNVDGNAYHGFRIIKNKRAVKLHGLINKRIYPELEPLFEAFGLIMDDRETDARRQRQPEHRCVLLQDWPHLDVDDADHFMDALEQVTAHFPEGKLYDMEHTPLEYTTADGYTFTRQPDGSYSDGDMRFSSWMAMRAADNG